MTPLLILLLLLPLHARRHRKKQVQDTPDPFQALSQELEDKYKLFDQPEDKPKAVITQRPIKALWPFSPAQMTPLPRQEEEAEHPVSDFSMQKYSQAQEEICTSYSDRATPQKAKEITHDAIQSLISLNTYNCNYEWSYLLQGNDWGCMCQLGRYQSPVSLPNHYSMDMAQLKQAFTLQSQNIYFDLAPYDHYAPRQVVNPQTFRRQNNQMDYLDGLIDNLKNSLQDDTYVNTQNWQSNNARLENDGRALRIRQHFGSLLLPLFNIWYQSKEIHLHLMSEHLVGHKRYPLELHINYQVVDYHNLNKLMDPYVSVVFLFDFTTAGLQNQFLASLPLEQIPPQNKYIKLDSTLDLNLLFDTGFYKQKMVKHRLGILKKQRQQNAYQAGLDQAIDKAQKQLEHLEDSSDYDPHFPLTRYLGYHGSQSTPPCNQNVKYIIAGEVQPISMQQFQLIKQAIMKNDKTGAGNYRAVQNLNGRKVELFDREITSLEPFLAKQLEDCPKKEEAKIDTYLQ